MPRPEQPFASFKQTLLPGPVMMTAPFWPLADVPKRMTLVHGRVLLPLFKSPERSVNFAPRRFIPALLRYYFTRCGPNRAAAQRWRTGPIQRAFLARFQSAANSGDNYAERI